MSELKDESIHLVATSPPYWQLKDYGTENQIGFHDDYETGVKFLCTKKRNFQLKTTTLSKNYAVLLCNILLFS